MILIRYKDEKLIVNTENILIECKNKVFHILSIKSISKNDIGIYSIKAKNEIGENLCSFKLFVDGKF
jgi:hypothetical protein